MINLEFGWANLLLEDRMIVLNFILFFCKLFMEILNKAYLLQGRVYNQWANMNSQTTTLFPFINNIKQIHNISITHFKHPFLT